MTIIVLATVRAEAAKCVGANPSTGKLLIVYKCNVTSANVQSFTPKGVHVTQFAANAQEVISVPTDMHGAVKPHDIPMTFSGGGNCVAGFAKDFENQCVGLYELPCAERRFELAVTLDPKPEQSSYSVLRSVRRSESATRCDLENRREDGGTIYSDSERITVTVFVEKPQKAMLFQTDLHLDRIDSSYEETWNPRAQEKRIASDEHGQGRGAVSENARWIAAEADRLAKAVTITVRPK
ncbi:MAG TPA: hypothetical protein VJZ00_19345 [Thermoanaerobaculia bacterium]|nr:hypothetical protein [Thermoanaerobaculia bacterium]